MFLSFDDTPDSLREARLAHDAVYASPEEGDRVAVDYSQHDNWRPEEGGLAKTPRKRPSKFREVLVCWRRRDAGVGAYASLSPTQSRWE